MTSKQAKEWIKLFLKMKTKCDGYQFKCIMPQYIDKLDSLRKFSCQSIWLFMFIVTVYESM